VTTMNSEQVGPFHVLVAGAGNSTTILMVHGLGATSALWEEAMPALASNGFQVIAVDIRGHGDSKRPDRLFTVEDHADSLRSIVQHYSRDGAHIVGNSLGALIAFSFASQFPELTKTVTAIGCPVWGSYRERQEWLHARSALVDLDSGMPKPSEPLAESASAMAIQRKRQDMGIWLMNSIWTTATFDLLNVLHLVRAPVLVMYGESDWLKDTGRNLACLDSPRFVTVANAGHHTPLDQPRTVANEIYSFVNDHDK
jgi:pimeloyl-ACP methyl ester carboxylesterase